MRLRWLLQRGSPCLFNGPQLHKVHDLESSLLLPLSSTFYLPLPYPPLSNRCSSFSRALSRLETPSPLPLLKVMLSTLLSALFLNGLLPLLELHHPTSHPPPQLHPPHPYWRGKSGAKSAQSAKLRNVFPLKQVCWKGLGRYRGARGSITSDQAQ